MPDRFEDISFGLPSIYLLDCTFNDCRLIFNNLDKVCLMETTLILSFKIEDIPISMLIYQLLLIMEITDEFIGISKACPNLKIERKDTNLSCLLPFNTDAVKLVRCPNMM